MNPAGISRIALVTDFGSGIYVGQIHARLSALVPHLPVIDLIHDLPPFRPDLAAYLLPGLIHDVPRGTLYLCVVDPGVGGERDAVVVEADGDWLLGPDNGLLSRVVKRAERVRVYRIGWRPERLSASFHARDWFAPAAARLCLGEVLDLGELAGDALVGSNWVDALAAVVYVDGFGNLMCGLEAADYPADCRLGAAGRRLARARTFCEAPPAEPFWYENALGLVEIAVNLGRADQLLGLGPGDPVQAPRSVASGEANV